MHAGRSSQQADGAELRDLTRIVAADMEAIFPPAKLTGPVRSRVTTVRLEAAPSRGRSLSVVGLGGAGLGAVAVAATVFLTPPPLAPSRTPTVAAVALTSTRPAPPTAPAEAPQARPTSLAAATAASQADAPTRIAVQQPKGSAKTRATRAGSDRSRSVCSHLDGGAKARCAYPAVMAADRRLRAAYAQAVRAGVPRDALVDYRNQWARLRRQANHRPDRVIRSYAEMASDLSRLAENART